MTGVYLVRNVLTDEKYIGASSDVEMRWKQHRLRYADVRCKEYHKTLYVAMRYYGLNNFEFSILEECDKDVLDEHEMFWIAHFNTFLSGYNDTPGGIGCKLINIGDGHPKHKLCETDIINIRIRYANHERKADVYSDYSDRIGKKGFHNIWIGKTWQHVMMSVYNESNKSFHKHNTGNSGSKNGRTELTETDVKNIRLARKNGAYYKDVYKMYSDKLTLGSFVNIWSYRNWKNIVV